ncbi:MAG TPA: lipopolysaccharide kinase InaA family protein [Candidatus Binataceae bacterium]|nr:lipopolysaccharide kinase InaA family protein [Candidatus Binataceae bacterium]
MESTAFSVHKAESRVRAGWLEAGDGSRVFVKRIETRSPLRGLAERIRGSRARRAIRGAAMLAAANVAHPAPLAALEVRSRSGAVRVSYLVSEALENALTLSIFALGRHGELRRDLRRRIEITRAVAAAVRRMHDAGLYTRDLQETNLMLEADGAGFRVYFIDLEDFAHPRRVALRRRLLNLVHLDRSVGRFVGRAGRLRFLYAYLGDHPSRAEIRRTIGRLLRIRARLDRRAAQHGRRQRSMPAAVSAA